MRKLLIGIVVLTLVVGAGTLGFAYSGIGNGQGRNNLARGVNGPAMFGMNVPFYDPLNLSEEQEKEIEKLQEKYVDGSKKLAEQLKKKSQELNRLILSDSDIVKITILKEEINDLHYELLQIRTKKMQKIVDILSEKQIKKLNTINKGFRSTGNKTKARNFRNKHLIKELDLDNEQVEEVKKLYQKYTYIKQEREEDLTEDMIEELKKILTAEQIEKLKEIKK